MSMAAFMLTGSHRSSLKTALHRSQQAPAIFGQRPAGRLPGGGRPAFLDQETPNEFDSLEKLFFSCIQSADDKCALSCLERLGRRFGSPNERVAALRSLYDEAVAEGQSGLEQCLRNYDDILSQTPVNLPILKRRVALLRSLSRYTDAISSLVQLLEATPTDAEAWCELAELYQSQGMGLQAIFSLEEALLIVPHAWNVCPLAADRQKRLLTSDQVHARLGEVLYVYANSLGNDGVHKPLQSSIQHFCRSVELCNDYLRGFYGLALATSHTSVEGASKTTYGYDSLEQQSFKRLHALAMGKLAHILTTQCSLELHRRDYEENELAAVKELLNGSPDPRL
ncbi:uncharacterized protein DSM5745_00546 [Aspergillus mulundensis]|uniref:ER membrane protein complex subunit 2 n=1 Tax=Aspergillus mulundensis TaxID=1810919 RepID=A0A3D8T3U8_9EURO|nr:Uncharacterized protein DSM5745_00546 [Aspergillus mulundensis]RDW93224.1 Uncharacterized protein DSM5745_00546 [Aspergillus mulundensis]